MSDIGPRKALGDREAAEGEARRSRAGAAAPHTNVGAAAAAGREGSAGTRARSLARGTRWRPWLRALHRDAGYFVVGLTFIYALSGLAVNHIADWDPSFHQIDRRHELGGPLAGSDDQIKQRVLGKLGIGETPREVYRSEQQLEIVFDKRTLHVDTTSGRVVEEGQEPRFFLRLANWLHLNRGKKAWTIVADSYAVLLLVLASSGLLMIPGRKGLLGRGAVIALTGALVPALYVVLSGGP